MSRARQKEKNSWGSTGEPPQIDTSRREEFLRRQNQERERRGGFDPELKRKNREAWARWQNQENAYQAMLRETEPHDQEDWEYTTGERQSEKRVENKGEALPPEIDVVRACGGNRSTALAMIQNNDDPTFRAKGIQPHLTEDRDGESLWQRLGESFKRSIIRLAKGRPDTRRMPFSGDPMMGLSAEEFGNRVKKYMANGGVEVREYIKKDGTSVSAHTRSRPGQGGTRR